MIISLWLDLGYIFIKLLHQQHACFGISHYKVINNTDYSEKLDSEDIAGITLFFLFSFHIYKRMIYDKFEWALNNYEYV